MVRLWFLQIARVLALGFCALFAPPARAGGEIVYAARYYSPTVRGKTHYHLYRIGENGQGKTQITRGKDEDSTPFWSPDGKKILFLRDSETGSDIMLTTPRGGAPTLLLHGSRDDFWTRYAWSPDGKKIGVARSNAGKSALDVIDVATRKTHRIAEVEDFAWSPDGKKLLLKRGERLFLRDTKTARERQTVSMGVSRFVWLDNAHFALLRFGPAGDRSVYDSTVFGVDSFDLHGKAVRSIDLSKTFGDNPPSSASRLRAIRGHRNAMILIGDYSLSDGPAKEFALLDFTHRSARILAGGLAISPSPDGRRAALVSLRDLTRLPKSFGTRERYVYTAQLGIATLDATLAKPQDSAFGEARNEIKPIVSGLVDVTWADWRAASSR